MHTFMGQMFMFSSGCPKLGSLWGAVLGVLLKPRVY